MSALIPALIQYLLKQRGGGGGGGRGGYQKSPEERAWDAAVRWGNREAGGDDEGGNAIKQLEDLAEQYRQAAARNNGMATGKK
jgi:hypothetical protein